MAGVNKALIVGRLTKDPETKYTKTGDAVCNFSVATSEKFTAKGGNDQEKAEFHRIVAWGKLAERCGQYLSKGRQVYVEGKIQTRTWDDNGIKRYTTEINAREVQFLGSNGNQQGNDGAYDAPPVPDEDIPF